MWGLVKGPRGCLGVIQARRTLPVQSSSTDEVRAGEVSVAQGEAGAGAGDAPLTSHTARLLSLNFYSVFRTLLRLPATCSR